MKKILIVTTKFTFPLFRGDNLRIYNISKYLSKKNKIDLIYTGSKGNYQKEIKFFNKTIFIKSNYIKKFFYIPYFLFKNKSLRVGYFFSSEMKKKISQIQKDYDCIIFHSIEASEYLPKNFSGTKILEMTDLKSNNYLQLYKKLSFYNPLKYLYLIEKKFLENYEKNIAKLFDFIILVSKQDQKIFPVKSYRKNKVKVIPLGMDVKKNIYKYKQKNNDVVFIGNINYHPNKIACFEFITEIMPKLKTMGVSINFVIIGQTSRFLKFLLLKHPNVKIYNNVKSPEKLCSKAICGIANLSVATGMQFKILEYMRMGLPAIISEKCYKSLSVTKNKDLLVFKNNNDFINKIIKLRNEKNFSNKISNNGYKNIYTNYTWEKVLKKYNELI